MGGRFRLLECGYAVACRWRRWPVIFSLGTGKERFSDVEIHFCVIFSIGKHT